MVLGYGERMRIYESGDLIFLLEEMYRCWSNCGT